MTALRAAAEQAEVRFTGLLTRGPTQSLPTWEAQLVELDHACRDAWQAWADEAFADA